MTFNEELLQQFKNVVANNEIFDCEGNDISDAIIVFLEQALVDKEKETLGRVMKCIGYTYESKLGQAVNRKCDGNEGFNLGVKSSYHDSKKRLEEEFKQ